MLEKIYDVAANAFPDFYKNFPFERWLNFLLTTGLAQEEGETLKNTLVNDEFLTYMTRNGLSEEKPF